MKWSLEAVRPLYLVEVHNVDDPGTQSCSRQGFLPHKLGIELRVTQVFLLHTPDRSLRDVLFVKVHQSLQEVVHLCVHVRVHNQQQTKTSLLEMTGEVLFFLFLLHRFPTINQKSLCKAPAVKKHLAHDHLGSLPAAVFGDSTLRRQQHQNGGRHVGDDGWRVRERPQLCQVQLGEDTERQCILWMLKIVTQFIVTFFAGEVDMVDSYACRLTYPVQCIEGCIGCLEGRFSLGQVVFGFLLLLCHFSLDRCHLMEEN